MSVSDIIASNFMRIQKAASKVSFSKADPKARAELAQARKASEAAYHVTNYLIPKGFDTELKALNDAINTCNKVFDKYTIHAEKSANGERNEGEKWIRAKHIADGSFLAEWNAAHAAFVQAHNYFVQEYPNVINRIEYASQYSDGLGIEFDRDRFPSQDDVRDKFALTLKGPFPIASGEIYRTMPLDEETRDAMETQYDAVLRRNIATVSQNIAADMAARLKTMAENLSKLAKFNATPVHLRTGKATAIHDTLTGNLQDAVAKARTFAIPETAVGSKLLDLVDQIEEALDPDRLDADYLKSLPPHHMASMADSAAALANALDACDWE